MNYDGDADERNSEQDCDETAGLCARMAIERCYARGLRIELDEIMLDTLDGPEPRGIHVRVWRETEVKTTCGGEVT